MISVTVQLSQRHAVTGCQRAQAKFKYHELWAEVGEFMVVAKSVHRGLQRAIDYWAVELLTAKLTFELADCTCSRASQTSERTLALGASWASDSSDTSESIGISDIANMF